MTLVLQSLSWTLMALAAAGTLYGLLAGALVGRFGAGGRPPPPAAAPPTTLLKPLHGAEPGLLGALQTFQDQRYGGAVQTVLGVQDPADPAVAVAEALRRRNPGADIALVVDAAGHGLNAKVSNLVNMMRVATGELLVVSDADMSATPDYLAHIAAAMADREVGVASLLYHGRATAPGFWPRFAAMGVSYGFLPMAALGVSLRIATPVMGSTIALRRETLEAVGGFGRVADHLADDYEIGRAVRALGLRSAIPPVLVAHGSADPSFGELWKHEVRWSRTIRLLDPLGHAGSVVVHATPLALLAALAGGFSAPSVGVLAAALASRGWVYARVDRTVGAATGPWWLAAARDLMSFAVFLASYVTRAVDWRGARFRVARDGALLKV